MTRRAYHVLLDVLRDEGVTHVFGNPGSTEMPLMDALVDAPDIAYVLGLQEATAVAMADGWALASGKVGFVNLHAMGGLGNAMGALVASKASETPLVVTAGQQDTRHLSSEPWLAGDLVALASPAMKWAGEARRGADVGKLVRRAFAIARTPPCGPVFLSLPMDVLGEEANEPAPPRSAPARLGPSPDAAALAEALRALRPGRRRRRARRRPRALGGRRAGRLRRSGRLRGVGHAAHLARRLPRCASVLGGRAEAGLRRDAGAARRPEGAGPGRRPRLHRLSLSRRRADPRRGQDLPRRRDARGVRSRARRRPRPPRRSPGDARRRRRRAARQSRRDRRRGARRRAGEAQG